MVKRRSKSSKTAPGVNPLADTVKDNGGVYFVPALTDLELHIGIQYARGVIIGITQRNHRCAHVRATLEGIAFQVYDVVKAMEVDAKEESVEQS